MVDKELLKGTLKTIILRLLSSYGRMHGYEIAKKAKQLTQGKVLITEGALYPALKKLTDAKLISCETGLYNGRKRKYYTVSEIGKDCGITDYQNFLEYTQHMLVLLNPE
ncbi:PadR family transcriptional regulator [Reichenbachiella versicolor]|uniref:PadR family transcriptional regulator n=1 Tax=Reichenbachiella versicolor TaxID=1821036 RepID=UPI000D6E171A|nr:helix-turn-helix transcriptional regulator [Reichenbachiella versicolor]